MPKNNQENNEDIYNMQTTWRILNSSPRSPLLTDSKLKEKKKRFSKCKEICYRLHGPVYVRTAIYAGTNYISLIT